MSAGVPGAAERDHRADDVDAGEVAGGLGGPGHGRVDDARRDRVDGDALPGEVHRERLGQRDDATLRRAVVRHVGRARLRALRRDRHDAAPPGVDHVRDRDLDAQERAGEVDLDDPRPRLRRDLEQRLERLDPRAGDEDPDRRRARSAPSANAASTDPRSATSTSTASARAPWRAQVGRGRLRARDRCGRAARRRDPRRRAAARRRARCPTRRPVTTATRLIGRHHRRPLEVQRGHAAEDPRRLVVEATRARRAVMLLGEADVARAVEDALRG